MNLGIHDTRFLAHDFMSPIYMELPKRIVMRFHGQKIQT